VKLYVDLETLQLIEGPGFRNPVTSLRFKRGDAAQLEVTFLEGGTTAASIGNPLALEIQFGIKPRSRYDIGYLVHDSVWTMPAVDAESPVYQCSPSFNTVELDSALGVGSATGTELSEIALMGEITWREGAGQPTSTRTFLVVVENDVNRGTEGVPTSAEPPYPAPESLVTQTELALYAKTEDITPDELTSDPVNEVAQKVTITGTPSPSVDTEISFTVDWGEDSVTVSFMLYAEDSPPAYFIAQTFVDLLTPEFELKNQSLSALSVGNDVIVRWSPSKPQYLDVSSDYGSPAVACANDGTPATIATRVGQSVLAADSNTQWTAVSFWPHEWKPSAFASSKLLGTLGINGGGTGATNVSAARANLGAAALSHTHVIANISDAASANLPAINTPLATALAGKVSSNVTGLTGATAITNMIQITQAGYNAITPAANTLYIIT
jgi:hypothetical protein